MRRRLVRLSSRRSFRLAVCLVLGITVHVSVPAAAEIVIHTPDEILTRWTAEAGGKLYFQSPEGEQWEMVTAIDDPAVLNPGQGAFYPLDPAAVREALDAVTVPGQLLSGDVFVLPYPRRDLMASNAGDRAIYLSPGVAPLAADRVHALVAHEMGHLVHKALLPDDDVQGWMAYRAVRGIQDASIYNAQADHRNRPHEIFAEDFRVLFGGPAAAGSGSIENRDLAVPAAVPGLRAFIASLADPERLARVLPTQRLVAFPNPSPGAVRFELTGAAPENAGPARLAVFDVRGRRVAVRDGDAASWDGRGTDGAPVSPGIYFLRVVRGGQAWTGKVLIRR
jgi:hypothetical protein